MYSACRKIGDPSGPAASHFEGCDGLPTRAPRRSVFAGVFIVAGQEVLFWFEMRLVGSGCKLPNGTKRAQHERSTGCPARVLIGPARWGESRYSPLAPFRRDGEGLARSGIPTEELSMPSEAASTGPPETSPAEEDHAIRERVRELMSQILRQGQIDPEGVKEVMRSGNRRCAVRDGLPRLSASGTEFADTVRRLDAALAIAAEATHRALETVAIRGKDVTDNDIKACASQLDEATGRLPCRREPGVRAGKW